MSDATILIGSPESRAAGLRKARGARPTPFPTVVKAINQLIGFATCAKVHAPEQMAEISDNLKLLDSRPGTLRASYRVRKSRSRVCEVEVPQRRNEAFVKAFSV